MALKFKDGKFTILQVSDAQDLQYVRKTMMKMLDKAHDRVKPDLIVLTGDNVLGNHFRDAKVLTPLFVKTKEAEFKAYLSTLSSEAKAKEKAERSNGK